MRNDRQRRALPVKQVHIGRPAAALDMGFRRLSLSGVPSFALSGHVLFSGAMPSERMADVFRRALAILRSQDANAAI